MVAAVIGLLILIRDTMAWWGALACIISLDDVVRWLRKWWLAKRAGMPLPTKASHAMSAAMAMAILCLGLLIIAIPLPLRTRLDVVFAGDTVTFRGPLALGHTLVAGAMWGFVCSRAARPAMIIAAAALALGGTALAAALTAGAA